MDTLNAKQSVFKNPAINLTDAQKLFRIYPYVFVENDIVYDVFAVLSTCKTWDTVANTKPYTVKRGEFCSLLSFPERTEYRYLLERKIKMMKQEVYNSILALQCLERTGSPVNETEEDLFYQNRSGEGSLFRKSSSKSNRTLLSDTTGTIHEDLTGKHIELSPQQEVILKAYRILRSIAIDLRLFVCLSYYCNV